jgi:hypothetical protein
MLRWMKRAVLPGLLIAFLVAGVAAAANKPISTRNVHLVGHLALEGGGMGGTAFHLKSLMLIPLQL